MMVFRISYTVTTREDGSSCSVEGALEEYLDSWADLADYCKDLESSTLIVTRITKIERFS